MNWTCFCSVKAYIFAISWMNNNLKFNKKLSKFCDVFYNYSFSQTFVESLSKQNGKSTITKSYKTVNPVNLHWCPKSQSNQFKFASFSHVFTASAYSSSRLELNTQKELKLRTTHQQKSFIIKYFHLISKVISTGIFNVRLVP